MMILHASWGPWGGYWLVGKRRFQRRPLAHSLWFSKLELIGS